MKNKLKSVLDFHKKLDFGYKTKPTAKIDPQTIQVRYDLMIEENKEYLEAAKEQDLVKIADALGDMLYVLCGTMITHGMQDKIDDVFAEIHRSNMTKSGRSKTGKAGKQEKYQKPNLEQFFEECDE